MKDTQTLGLFEERRVLKAISKSGDPDGLRYYQRDAFTSIFESLESNRSTLLVLATGLGKTETFCAIVKHWPGRVLVLAHREELIEQARKKLEIKCQERVEIEQADIRSSRARIVVGSIQTVYRDSRLESLARKGGFTLIVIDEAHHYVSPSFRKPIDFFVDAKILGVTATPDRGDSRALGTIFDDVAYTMGLREGVKAGYLTPLKGKEVIVEEINLDLVETNPTGDFQAGALDEMMIKGVEGVVKGMFKYSANQQGIVFFPGVRSAHMAAARMNAIREGSAVSVDGDTDKIYGDGTRKRIFEDFKRGKFQYLANCMVATEGFDAPSAAVCGMARPTGSRSLYAQCVGRVTRVLPGVVEHLEGREKADERRSAIAASAKPFATVIDFTGKNSKHRLMTPADILGGEISEPVAKRVKELQEDEENEDKGVEELLDQANREITQLELERMARQVNSKVKVRTRDFDPFSSLGIDYEQESNYALEYGYKPPTDAQIHTLKKQGFTEKELEGISRKAASKLITNTFQRRDLGLATKKQLETLHSYGVKDSNISQDRASKALDYIKENDWGRSESYDPVKVHDILFE